LTLPVLMKKK